MLSLINQPFFVTCYVIDYQCSFINNIEWKMISAVLNICKAEKATGKLAKILVSLLNDKIMHDFPLYKFLNFHNILWLS